MRASIIVASVAGSVVLLGLPSIASDDIASDDRIPFVGDELVFELVGEVTNFATPPPLGSSNQYGYLTKVRGIDAVFSGSPHNETTALFTFFNEATTTETNVDGPLRINARDGTTTIYLNSAPASFANPDSFRSGTPIQISTLHQQAIVDTATNTFTAVFVNTITEATKFTLNDEEVKLGRKGQAFRATLTGHLNAVAPPSGFFGGYAVSTSGR
jgi:hypothetical protein